MLHGIVISITPKKIDLKASHPKGFRLFSVDVHATQTDERAFCDMLLPTALVKTKEPTQEDGERLAAWVALGLLPEENQSARKLVELAWKEVSLFKEKRRYADLYVVSYHTQKQDRGWNFDWNEGKSLEEWSLQALSEQGVRKVGVSPTADHPSSIGRF